jgi:cytochrome b561
VPLGYGFFLGTLMTTFSTHPAQPSPSILLGPSRRYDLFTRTLHWIFASIIIYTMIAGFSLHIISNQALWKFVAMLNMSLATCLIPLFPVRYIWSFFRPEVGLPISVSSTQSALAHLVHSLIYVLTATVLVSGILMTPDGYWFFNVIHLPTPFTKGPVVDHWFVAHKVSCYALALLVVVHIGAALKHHFVNRNSVLRRML